MSLSANYDFDVELNENRWFKLKENDESIYQLILEVNKINKNYVLLCEVVSKDEAQYKDIKLRNCWVQNKILYWDDLLWVFFNEHLQIKLI